MSDHEPAQGPTAYLLDQMWPEYDRYVREKRQPADITMLPLPTRGRFSGPKFAWSDANGSKIKTATLIGIRRALRLRRVTNGAELQRVRLFFDRKLARRFGRSIPKRCRHLVVAQNLLPFLEAGGYLRERSFDVLLYRWPIVVLQPLLDAAFAQYPESTTLADFRADPELTAWETAAIERARRFITPHRGMKAHFGERAICLDWHRPPSSEPAALGNRVLFPAAVLGRKGAFEVRQLALDEDLEIQVLGPNHEGNGFWKGAKAERVEGDPFAGIGVVVLPAFIEAQPRLLLQAQAKGIPVVTTEATGLENGEGITVLPVGDYPALRRAVLEALDR